MLKKTFLFQNFGKIYIKFFDWSNLTNWYQDKNLLGVNFDQMVPKSASCSIILLLLVLLIA